MPKKTAPISRSETPQFPTSTQITKIEERNLDKEKTEVSYRKPYLFVIPETGFGRWYPIDQKEITIGRSRESSIQIESVSISRVHIRILTLGPDNYILEDLDSTNGTYVNGQKIKSHQLQSGDKISLSNSVILMFEIKDKDDVSMYENLYRSATRDALTGVYNRLYFLEIGQKEFAFAKRHFSIFSLVFFDIDHFKSLNDRFGHLFGDVVLQKIAETVSKYTRSSDIFARVGGEEFVILLRNILPFEATFLAEKIRTAIESVQLKTPSGVDTTITTSLGVISFDPEKFESLEQMLEAVDKRLYQAKQQGRNRTVIDDLGRRENRKYPRYPFQTTIKIPGSSLDYSFETMDLSFGGIRVRAQKSIATELEAGSTVCIVFEDEMLSLNCLGKIARVYEDTDGYQYLGIQFEDLSREQMEEIKRGIQRLKKASYKKLLGI